MSASAAVNFAAHQVSVHSAQVAGRFYPADPATLASRIDAALAGADSGAFRAKMVVMPHAGLDYCAGVAAVGARAIDASTPIRRIVLLGPNHRWRLRGAAIHPAAAWSTPLGITPVADAALAALASLEGVSIDARPFTDEHSLEMPLLFLQRLFLQAEVAPILVGDAAPELVEEILRRTWGGPETAIVISSDLSHYLPADEANARDARTRALIETGDDGALGASDACGFASLKGALRRARALRMRATGLALTTSDMAGGPKDRVVGYGAFGFEYPGVARLADSERLNLVATASACIRFAAEHTGAAPQIGLRPGQPAALTATRGAFVTLERNGALRGCIGSPVPHRALAIDVGLNAIKAGFADPRFPGLKPDELAGLNLRVSVLSPHSPIEFASEAELVEQLRPDRDGLILRDGDAAALFLPSVWRDIPDPREFLKRLKLKMGAPADAQSPTMSALRFETEDFGGRYQEG